LQTHTGPGPVDHIISLVLAKFSVVRHDQSKLKVKQDIEKVHT